MSSSATATSTSSSLGPSSSSSGFQGSSLFGTNGSPPLILAFLALGLFGVALAVVYGFRRMHIGRWGPAPRILVATANGIVDLGEKPKLWDFWTTGAYIIPESGRGYWDEIMPFSAVIVEEEDSEGAADKDNTGASQVPRPPLQALAHAGAHSLLNNGRRRLKQLIGRNNRGDAYAMESISEPESGKKADAARTPNSPPWKLQIAVAILPPSPYPLYPKGLNMRRCSSGSHDSQDDDEILEYNLGVVEIPWQQPDQG